MQMEDDLTNAPCKVLLLQRSTLQLHQQFPESFTDCNWVLGLRLRASRILQIWSIVARGVNFGTAVAYMVMISALNNWRHQPKGHLFNIFFLSTDY